MDKATIDRALQTFSDSLPEKPKWVILITYKGKFVSRVGEYEDDIARLARDMATKTFKDLFPNEDMTLSPLNDLKVADLMHEYTVSTTKITAQLRFGSDTFSILGGDGVYIFWYTFRYTVGISYYSTGVNSFDRTLEAIYNEVAELYEKIAPIDGVWED